MKTKLLQSRRVTIIVLFLLMNELAVGCSSIIANHDVNVVPATEIVDAVSNDTFINMVDSGGVDDINSGITISEMKSFDENGVPTLVENYYSFLILNHSLEAIKFINIGFDIQVFEYFPNSKNEIWKKANLPYTPEKTEKILPPNLEKFDFQLINAWSFFEEQDFVDIESEIIRVYIFGIGTETKINYHAFVDIKIR